MFRLLSLYLFCFALFLVASVSSGQCEFSERRERMIDAKDFARLEEELGREDALVDELLGNGSRREDLTCAVERVHWLEYRLLVAKSESGVGAAAQAVRLMRLVGMSVAERDRGLLYVVQGKGGLRRAHGLLAFYFRAQQELEQIKESKARAMDWRKKAPRRIVLDRVFWDGFLGVRLQQAKAAQKFLARYVVLRTPWGKSTISSIIGNGAVPDSVHVLIKMMEQGRSSRAKAIAKTLQAARVEMAGPRAKAISAALAVCEELGVIYRPGVEARADDEAEIPARLSFTDKFKGPLSLDSLNDPRLQKALDTVGLKGLFDPKRKSAIQIGRQVFLPPVESGITSGQIPVMEADQFEFLVAQARKREAALKTLEKIGLRADRRGSLEIAEGEWVDLGEALTGNRAVAEALEALSPGVIEKISDGKRREAMRLGTNLFALPVLKRTRMRLVSKKFLDTAVETHLSQFESARKGALAYLHELDGIMRVYRRYSQQVSQKYNFLFNNKIDGKTVHEIKVEGFEKDLSSRVAALGDLGYPAANLKTLKSYAEALKRKRLDVDDQLATSLFLMPAAGAMAIVSVAKLPLALGAMALGAGVDGGRQLVQIHVDGTRRSIDLGEIYSAATLSAALAPVAAVEKLRYPLMAASGTLGAIHAIAEWEKGHYGAAVYDGTVTVVTLGAAFGGATRKPEAVRAQGAPVTPPAPPSGGRPLYSPMEPPYVDRPVALAPLRRPSVASPGERMACLFMRGARELPRQTPYPQYQKQRMQAARGEESHGVAVADRSPRLASQALTAAEAEAIGAPGVRHASELTSAEVTKLIALRQSRAVTTQSPALEKGGWTSPKIPLAIPWKPGADEKAVQRRVDSAMAPEWSKLPELVRGPNEIFRVEKPRVASNPEGFSVSQIETRRDTAESWSPSLRDTGVLSRVHSEKMSFVTVEESGCLRIHIMDIPAPKTYLRATPLAGKIDEIFDPRVRALLEAIAENPDDLASRYALADYLSEQVSSSDQALGEFMQCQLAIETMQRRYPHFKTYDTVSPADRARFLGHAKRSAELLTKFGSEWLSPLLTQADELRGATQQVFKSSVIWFWRGTVLGASVVGPSEDYAACMWAASDALRDVLPMVKMPGLLFLE